MYRGWGQTDYQSGYNMYRGWGQTDYQSGYNMYRGWGQTDYQSRHCAIDHKDEGTQDDRGRDGLTEFTLRIKEQATRVTPFFDDDDDDDDITTIIILLLYYRLCF